jgi:hypothetical protein
VAVVRTLVVALFEYVRWHFNHLAGSSIFQELLKLAQ